MSELDLFGVGRPAVGAVLSSCGRYRYRLWRQWAEGSAVCFVMLNPSTADAAEDDPTVRRCLGFARTWGYGALEVVNLYAWRATDPRELRRTENGMRDPVGPENDQHLVSAAGGSVRVVCAWGNNAHPESGRVRAVCGLLLPIHGELWALRETKAGCPEHPLFVPGSTEPVKWR